MTTLPHLPNRSSMLTALWRLGTDRFAIETQHIVEIVPLVNARRPGALEPWLLGLFNHRGTLLPLVDTALVLNREPIPRRLHARIIVCWLDPLVTPDAPRRAVGLVVEELLGVDRLHVSPTAMHPGLRSVDGVELGSLMVTSLGEIQLIDPTRLFSRAQRALLLHEHQEAVT